MIDSDVAVLIFTASLSESYVSMSAWIVESLVVA